MGLLLYSIQVIDMTDVTQFLAFVDHNFEASSGYANEIVAQYSYKRVYTQADNCLTVNINFPQPQHDCYHVAKGAFAKAWPIEGHPVIPGILYGEVEDYALRGYIPNSNAHDIWISCDGRYRVEAFDYFRSQEGNGRIAEYHPTLGWLPLGTTEDSVDMGGGLYIRLTDLETGFGEAWPVMCPFPIESRFDGTDKLWEYDGCWFEELAFTGGNYRQWLYRGELYEEDGSLCVQGVHDYYTNVPLELGYPIPKALCMGLEAEFCDYDGWTVRDAYTSFDGKALFKEDSSCGIEMVTVPLLPSEMMAFIDNLAISKLGVDSTCGVHVHLSRKYLTQSQIGGLVVFMNHPDNLWYIEAVAGRAPNKYCQFKAGKSDLVSDDRYEMVNLTNSATVEIRIFAGTNSTDTLRGYVEWLLDLLKWLGTNPSSYLATEFIAFNK